MIDFEKRLKSLKDRRQGTREQNLLEKGHYSWDSNDYRTRESYEKLSESVGVRYAIGAMAPVEQNSTNVSISEGNRVADTLILGLKASGIDATKRLQGSVALDIHIKGHSDVDMLIMLNNIVLVELPKLDGSQCWASDNRPMADIVAELRTESERKLTSRYPQVYVDCSNNKSISLEGGSLQRKVDIVPSCWYDSHNYQRSGQEYDRGVKIYHKSDHALLGNFPFTHIKNVNDKDYLYDGNLKRVIRLLKNMVADMPDYKKRVAKNLSSYDLAGIAYHMNNELQIPNYMSLGLVEKTRAHLSSLANSKIYRESLDVPDGTRRIFNSVDKTDALEILEKEIDDLTMSIFKELKPFTGIYSSDALTSRVIT
ncbi:MAG: hypothetical protein ACRBBR_08815 [Cellvibrionaceae bacterium]